MRSLLYHMAVSLVVLGIGLYLFLSNPSPFNAFSMALAVSHMGFRLGVWLLERDRLKGRIRGRLGIV